MNQVTDTTQPAVDDIDDIIDSVVEPSQTNTVDTSSEKKKKDFAAMNGVSSVIAQEALPSSRQEAIEPEQVITVRPISQNPLIKIGVVASGIFLFIAVIGSVINGSMSALKQSTAKTEDLKKGEGVSQESLADDEAGETKTDLALTTQKERFEKLRNSKAQQQETLPKPINIAPPHKIKVIPRQQPVAVRFIPPQPKLVATSRTPQPKPVAVSRPIKQALITRVQAQVQPVDAMQQWQVAANIGSFFSSDEPDELPGVSGIEGGTGQSTEVSAKNVAPGGKNTQEVDYNAPRVLVGSKTEGKLETPIAWSPQNSNKVAQNYLIKISKPLKANDNSEVLPAGSYLVAQLINSNASGFVQLEGVTVLVNKDGHTQEKQLPENSVLILSKEGSFLKAESRKGSNVGRSLISAVVAGVTKAVEIRNRPTSQITTSSDISTSSTTNQDKDLLSGFGEGAFGNILEDIQADNERQASEFNSQDKVFVIDAGKTVQIFINQAISL
jgi:hypothetical protein